MARCERSRDADHVPGQLRQDARPRASCHAPGCCAHHISRRCIVDGPLRPRARDAMSAVVHLTRQERSGTQLAAPHCAAIASPAALQLSQSPHATSLMRSADVNLTTCGLLLF